MRRREQDQRERGERMRREDEEREGGERRWLWRGEEKRG